MPTPQQGQLGRTLAIARSGPVSLQSLTNLYMEPNPEGSKSAFTLYGTPGLKLWATVGDGPIRGIERMGSYTYVVSGSRVYSVNSALAVTDLGFINGAGNVHTTNNGTHVAVVVPNGKAYAVNTSGVLELPITECIGVAYQDGYTLFLKQDGSFYISALDDMTTIDPLDYAYAEGSPDGGVGIISDHREVLVFGTETIEWFYNSGAKFPFDRAGGGFSEHGCRSGGSIAKAENAVFFLGNDLAVYMLRGYQPEVISTPWLEEMIKGASDPGSCWAFTYRQLGHIFYVLTFSDLTIVYDITTGAWHKRESDGLSKWRANRYASVGDLHIVGDCVDGRLYELDLDTCTDGGDIIRREMVSSPVQANGQRAIMHELYVDCETGVGLPNGQGSDPQMVLDWTDDGGATWSNSLSRSMGAIGERKKRVTWNRLGAFRQRSFRIAISDPVKIAVIAAYVRMEALGA